MGSGAIKFLLVVLALVVFPAAARAAAPRVVTSIKPLHSLAAGIMDGVGNPALLLNGAGSPHTYSLKPSDAATLRGADVVFWVGPIFETFLEKPLTAMQAPSRVFAMMNAPGLDLGQRDGHSDAVAADMHRDGHLWLDPQRAKLMTLYMSEVLIARDGVHAGIYRDNTAKVLARLDALDERLRRQLAPVAMKPYIVFHDAYGYFEQRYGLRHVGAITVSPDRPPGARRIAEIGTEIKTLKAVCIFTEPQFEPKLIRSLSGAGTRFGELDPEGSTLAMGQDLVFNLLQDLADNFVRCLSPS